MANHDDFATIGRVPGVLDCVEHPRFDAEEGFTPAGLHGVDQLRPRARVAEHVGKPEAAALEPIGGLNYAFFGHNWQFVALRPRLGRLLSSLQRARVESRKRPIGEARCGNIRHLVTEFAEVIPGKPAIKNAVRIVHFTMANEMDEVCWHGIQSTSTALPHLLSPDPL